MSERRALVTGGAGFIGSHLCEHLVSLGWRVTALDDLSTGSEKNVVSLSGNERFRLVVADAADAIALADAAEGAETVFHLASVVGVRRVMEDTIQTIEKNLHGMEAVLALCAKSRLRFLTASSSEVYGASVESLFREDDHHLIGPSRFRRWTYAAVKLLEEFHAFAYHYGRDLRMTVVRPFNTIGPRQVGRYGMVVPTFVRQALEGQPITVLGDGSQTRCFTAVSDMVRCMYDLTMREETVGQVFNVGSTEEISILHLAERVKALTQSDSSIVFRAYKEEYGEDFVDLQRRKPDISRLSEAIGYVPDTPLDESLTRVIDAMRSRG